MSAVLSLDFVLRLLFARVMDVAFVVHVFDVHAHDFAADPASLRVPTYVIANFELLSHGERPTTRNANRRCTNDANRTLPRRPRSQGQCFLGNLGVRFGVLAFRGRRYWAASRH